MKNIWNRLKTVWDTRQARITRARNKAVQSAADVLRELDRAEDVANTVLNLMLVAERVSGKKLPGLVKAQSILTLLTTLNSGWKAISPAILAAITAIHNALNENDKEGWDLPK